jgi:hypothetical protein
LLVGELVNADQNGACASINQIILQPRQRSGKTRGVHLQNNDMMHPIFESWPAPFKDLSTGTITIRNTGGPDHLSFDAVGLPGFEFMQDPLDYESRTHHFELSMITQNRVISCRLRQSWRRLFTMLPCAKTYFRTSPAAAAPAEACVSRREATLNTYGQETRAASRE